MTDNKKLQHQLDVTICLGNQIWSCDDEHISNESLKTHIQNDRFLQLLRFSKFNILINFVNILHNNLLF